jgi:diguanylate cyclase (GGDEF)-like protein/PAS domain S-box-containing protein
VSAASLPQVNWDQLPCPVSVVDAQGRELQGNRLWLKMGQCTESLFTDEAQRLLLQALAQRRDFALDLPCRASLASAGLTWLACQARWDNGLAAFVCVWQDVSVAQAAKRQTIEQAAQLRLVADNVPALIALYDVVELRCLFANREYARTLGFTEESILGQTLAEIIGATANALIEPQVERMLRERVTVTYERQLYGSFEPRWIEVSLIPHVNSDGQLLASFVLITDISKRRRDELAVRESEARLSKFMHATVEGILFHKDGLITDVNPPLCALTGFSLSEAIGQGALSFICDDERAKVAKVMASGLEVTYETAIRHRDGTRIPVEFIVRTLDRQNPSEGQRMTIVRDIRDRLAAQARIHHLAHRDGLTGLLNRAAFMAQLQQTLQDAGRTDRQMALLFIDLDNFKRVNDSLGHLEGDRVLSTVADRITDCLRSTDLVARFGGDEFVVLLRDVPTRADVMVVLMALLSVVEVPVNAHGCALSVTPSIGVALFPEHGETAPVLIQHADTAMYQAKAAGRATFQFFEPVLAEQAYADLLLESQLTQALERQEFVLYFQPQVAAHSGTLIGAEALLRWQHPARGLLNPEAFLGVAERHRLMLNLSEWVLRAAARQARAWHDSGVAAVPIAVNLARIQFRLDGFVDLVARVLAEEGVPGAWLELELTERLLMDEIVSVPDTLAALRRLGLTVAVDDFGTGYTALAHLSRLPLDKLKIDRSFVARLPDDAGAAAITRAIIQMAGGLGLQVCAVGVGRGEQWRQLADWGCDELQGDVIGPAMPAAAFEAWLLQRPGGRSAVD